MFKNQLVKMSTALSLMGIAFLLTGCSILGDIPAIPAHRVPSDFLVRSRDSMQEISFSRLRQEPLATSDDQGENAKLYRLDARDILGIYIEGVLGEKETQPPVHFPEEADQPPAIGFPVPVRDDGTINLPYLKPLSVKGKTVVELTEQIKQVYTGQATLSETGEIIQFPLSAPRDVIDGKKYVRVLVDGQERQYEVREILKDENVKVIVTLLRRRVERILVVREDTNVQASAGGAVLKRGIGSTVDLPAYENDLLHALNETGGLPGLDARNLVFIIRGLPQDGLAFDKLRAAINSCQEPCGCPPDLPEDPNITIIPIRYFPENVPTFTEEDIILNTGDIVYIPSRDNELFYTGGLLRGGEMPLPRDRDLDVLGAIALAGGQIGSGGSGFGGGGGGGGIGGGGGRSVGAPPSNLIVLRNLDCGGQIPIRVDLNRALVDPSARILVKPGDTLILKYTFTEELYNALINTVQFNFLFNGLQGGGF